MHSCLARVQVQAIAFGVSFLLSQIPVHHLVLWVSSVTFRRKETDEIEIGDSDYMTLQIQ